MLDRWWPLYLAVAFAVVTAAAGFALSTRRDVGASLFDVRPGRPRAAAYLGSPWGLALRLQRANIFGWGAALFIGGLAFGAYTDALIEALADLPEVFVELFGGAEDMVAGYLAYMATFVAYLAAAFAILAVQGLRTEETRGRLEPVLATPVSRGTWLGANLAVSAAAVVVLMLLAGAGTGLGAALVTGDGRHVWELAIAHLNHVPGVLVVLGVAALLFGFLPRAIPVSWAIVGYGMIVGTFGHILDVPEVAFDLSPFEHPARMPLEAFAATPVATLSLVEANQHRETMLRYHDAFNGRDLETIGDLGIAVSGQPIEVGVDRYIDGTQPESSFLRSARCGASRGRRGGRPDRRKPGSPPRR